jgi:hypothetical protein
MNTLMINVQTAAGDTADAHQSPLLAILRTYRSAASPGPDIRNRFRRLVTSARSVTMRFAVRSKLASSSSRGSSMTWSRCMADQYVPE